MTVSNFLGNRKTQTGLIGGNEGKSFYIDDVPLGGGLDLYHLLTTVGAGTDDLEDQCIASWGCMWAFDAEDGPVMQSVGDREKSLGVCRFFTRWQKYKNVEDRPQKGQR